MGAMLLATPMMLTSCDELIGELDNIGTEDTRVLAAALKEGAVITYTYTKSDVEYTVSFVKEGDKYVLQNQPSTRVNSRDEARKVELWGVPDNSDTSDPTPSNLGSYHALSFRVYEPELALDLRTNVADGTSTMVCYDSHFGIKDMTVNYLGFPNVNKGIKNINNAVKNNQVARFKYIVPPEGEGEVGRALLSFSMPVFSDGVSWGAFIRDYNDFIINGNVTNNPLILFETALATSIKKFKIIPLNSEGEAVEPVRYDDKVGKPSFNYEFELITE